MAINSKQSEYEVATEDSTNVPQRGKKLTEFIQYTSHLV